MNKIILEQTELTYTYGNSNKFYRITISHDAALRAFKVEAEWGRIGNNPQIASKYIGSNRAAAWNVYQKLRDSKTQKGYDIDNVNQGSLEQKIALYKKYVYDLTANGLVDYPQRMQLEALLESGDPDSFNTAVKIIDVKREKQAA